jgi:photosystem II stability/assembly factor-like uncharacterized protein
MGIIVATDDGGATWTVQQPASTTGSILLDVEFVDAQRGWATGMGELLRTTDGGRTWTSSKLPGDMYDLGFVDARRGFAAGRGVVLATTDGGLTWEPRLDLGLDVTLLNVSFLNAEQGWAVGIDRRGDRETSIVLETTDGGRGWTRVDPGRDGMMRGLAVTAGGNAWAVGTEVLTNTRP